MALESPMLPWHDTAATRLAALALVESLNAELLASQSATLTLEHWCAAHALADGVCDDLDACVRELLAGDAAGPGSRGSVSGS